jgi:hypothetical protein
MKFMTPSGSCLSVIFFLPCVVVIGCSAKQQASKIEIMKPANRPVSDPGPTLKFNIVKDVPGLIDEDALQQEEQMKKRLPGNEFVGTQRMMHEATLGTEFIDAFKDAKECNGITFFERNAEAKTDFTLQVGVSGHDKHSENQDWTWMLFYPSDPSPKDSMGHGMGGMGSQSNAQLTARDVCLTIWDDIAPNHFKRQGGTVQ